MTEPMVYLDGLRCGVVTQTAGGALTFDYDVDYLTRPGATPLSMSMPISSPHHANRSIRPFLAGLLPDSEQALAALGRQFDVSAKSPFALLGPSARTLPAPFSFSPRAIRPATTPMAPAGSNP